MDPGDTENAVEYMNMLHDRLLFVYSTYLKYSVHNTGLH